MSDWQWVNGQKLAVLVLDEYEVANLRAAIVAIWYPANPLNVLNSGDWVGQIYQKLPASSQRPNATPESYVERAKNWMPYDR